MPVKKIGLTGGIGSGKSLISKIFKIYGVPVYDSDSRAKALMIKNENLIDGIKALFGEKAYLEDGALNRPYIASIVFEQQDKLRKLNSMVHPAVGMDFMHWANEQKSAYVLKEAALTFESHSEKLLDKVIMVYAPEDVRIRRVMKRDDADAEAIRKRMENQWPDEKKMELSDYVIYNDGEKLVIPQVHKIHKDLLHFSGT